MIIVVGATDVVVAPGTDIGTEATPLEKKLAGNADAVLTGTLTVAGCDSTLVGIPDALTGGPLTLTGMLEGSPVDTPVDIAIELAPAVLLGTGVFEFPLLEYTLRLLTDQYASTNADGLL